MQDFERDKRQRQGQRPAPAIAEHSPAQLPVRPGEKPAEFRRQTPRLVQAFAPSGPKRGDLRPGIPVRADVAAALSALVRSQPQSVVQALQTLSPEAFQVRLFERNGQGGADPHSLIIDGYLPSNALQWEAGHPGPWLGMWPAILEKALATWHGSYAALGPGNRAGDVITALTGREVRTLPTQWPDAVLMQWLGTALAKGEPVLCSGGGDDDGIPRKPFVVHVVVSVQEIDGRAAVQIEDPLVPDDPLIVLDISHFRNEYTQIHLMRPDTGQGAPAPA